MELQNAGGLGWVAEKMRLQGAELTALRAEVERLREERRWRTFPANLPDANGRYVCMWADGDMYIQRWHGSKWLGAFDHDITHWQPLPAPPASAKRGFFRWLKR